MLANGYQALALAHAHLDEIEQARAALARALELRPALNLAWVDRMYAKVDPELRERYRQGFILAGLEE
jgi:hypothetical protein